MAEKKVVVDIEVDASASVNSMKSIKAEIKSLQGAALQGNQDAIKRIAELKDKIEDLGDATKTLKGSGVEKVTSSFGLLGQGFKDFDFDKIKTGFKGIGSAMSAIPIFLVAEGVAYLVENWKELGEGNGIVAKGIQLLNMAFDEITGTITKFTDMIGLSNSALDKQGEAIRTNADKAKEALSNQSAEYDRQIRVAKAAGKSTIELEQAKQQAIIDTNLAVARQIEAFVRAGGEFDEEKRKLLTASLEAIKNAKVTEFEIEQNHTKDLKAEYKKRSDDKKKELDDLFNLALQEQEKEEQWRTQDIKKKEEEEKKLNERRAKDLQDLNALQLKADQDEVASKVAMWAEEDRLRKEDKAQHEKDLADKFAITQQSLQTTQALSDLVFTFRLNQLKKGSAEELKVRKQQFQVEKAFKVAQIVMDGIQGATKAYAMNPLPSPIGVASAILQGVASAAAATKVLATKFDAGSAPSVDAGPSLSIGGGGANTSAPNTQAPSTGSIQPFTRLDESGRNQSMPMIKTYVVESEMSDSQKRVGRLTEQASFG